MKRPELLRGAPERHSLQTRIFLGILLPMAVVLILLFLLNTIMLGPFYQLRKQAALKDAFRVVNNASAKDELLTSAFQLRFEQLCDRDSLSITVTQADGTVVLSSSSDEEKMLDRLRQIIFQMDENEVTLLSSTDSYILLRQQDSRLQGSYLVLWGNLSGGDFILIRTAISGIRESVQIANRFLLYGALAAIVFGLCASYLIASYITRPVRRLAELSRRMAKLDFDASYVPTGTVTEIDELGSDMNELSGTLKQAIGDLKTANSDLQRDIERREKNEQMRKEFLSNVSHELKTPISVISGYAEGLLEGVPGDEESTREYAEIIMDEAGRMGRLVREISALNELEYGAVSVEMERFNLYDVVWGVVRSQVVLADHDGITVQNEIDPETCVWADVSLTEQIVSNYLSNAIHYAKGEKTIRLYGEIRGGRYWLCVFNSGDPIPEDSLSRVWDKFYKVDKARSRAYGGSGIGLSLVKASAESMQQEVGVENVAGGVLFRVSFDTSA